MTLARTIPDDPTTEASDAVIQERLDQLGKRLLRWALIEGACRWLALVIALVIAWVAIDYLVEPSRSLRMFLLIAAVVTIITLATSTLRHRLRRRPARDSLALLLERRFPSLADRLVTAVERGGANEELSIPLLRRVKRSAARELSTLPIGQAIVIRPTVRLLMILGGVLALVATSATLFPVIATTWWRRSILLAPINYPRQTRLALVDFEEPVRKVGRGRDHEILVEVDPTGVHPATVRIRYRLLSSRQTTTAYMVGVGPQRYRHQFRNILEPIAFDVIGGDDRTPLKTLVDVTTPHVSGVTARVAPPEYRRSPVQRLKWEGAPLAIPQGSRVELDIAFDKSIDKADLHLTSDSKISTALPLTPSETGGWSANLILDKNLSLQVGAVDKDGIALTDSATVDLVSIEDEAPVVQAQPRGVGAAITPTALVPLLVGIKDDVGIVSAELRWESISPPTIAASGPTATPTKPTEPKGARPLDLQPGDPRSQELSISLDVAELSRKPGDVVTVTVAARDAKPSPTPREGISSPLRFEIISLDELLSRLATRELNLRERFEQIIRELREIQRTLAQVSAGEERRAQASQSLAGFRKGISEANAIALEFHWLRDELANNRVPLASMRERIERGVVEPLDQWLREECAAGDAALVEWSLSWDKADQPRRLTSAQVALDGVIRKADQILAAMLKRQSFNEAVALLRALIADQEKLIEKTREERKRRLKNLVE